MKSKHHKYSFLCALLALMTILSMVMIIGTDTGWGKVEVTHQVLTSADGDEINSMLYKPKAADKDLPGAAMPSLPGITPVAIIPISRPVTVKLPRAQSQAYRLWVKRPSSIQLKVMTL